MEDEIREEGGIEEADEEYDFIESEGEGKIFLNLSIEDDGGDEQQEDGFINEYEVGVHIYNKERIRGRWYFIFSPIFEYI